MTHNTVTIRISTIHKTMLERFVSENFKEKNPNIEKPTFDQLMGYLIKRDMTIYYDKCKSEVINERDNK